MGVLNEATHREWWSCHHVFETSRAKAANAFGFAAIVAKGVFVQLGLQVLVAHGAVMGTKHPTPEAYTPALPEALAVCQRDETNTSQQNSREEYVA